MFLISLFSQLFWIWWYFLCIIFFFVVRESQFNLAGSFENWKESFDLLNCGLEFFPEDCNWKFHFNQNYQAPPSYISQILSWKTHTKITSCQNFPANLPTSFFKNKTKHLNFHSNVAHTKNEKEKWFKFFW